MRSRPPAHAQAGRSLLEAPIWWGGLVLVVAAVGLWWSAAPAMEAGLPALWWLAALFGAVCAGAGALGMRQVLAAQLRMARIGQQSLVELSEAWIWHSDAQHRLTDWRPPQGAPAQAWEAHSTALPHLWERFEVASGLGLGALRARLDAHAVLSGLRVRWVHGPDGGVWRLRALPQFDAQGRFAGYVGTALPIWHSEQQHFDLAVMDQLWRGLDQVAIALRPCPQGWEVASINPDAARLLGLASVPAAGTPWNEALQQLPPELQPGISNLAPGQQGQGGGWQLSLSSLDLPRPPSSADDGLPADTGRLLLLRRQACTVVSDTLSASDHESFVYSVSHDLRAPIRVVEGFARILKEDYGRFLDRIGNDHLDRVLAAAARMNSMIDALLALSRLQSQPLARKPVDLSQLASFIVEDLRSEAPERSAQIHIEPGLQVQGDPTLLRIAMENLLSNAWKYSAQSAQTVIEFRREERDGQRVFVVADQGAGFDMRFADRLFGVFQRLHSPKDFQGTGVGLASVRRILRRHGGDIWAESEVGRGARFYFTLPS